MKSPLWKTLKYLTIFGQTDKLNSWLTNTEREIKTVSVSRHNGCQVQWVCSYLILLLLYTHFTLPSHISNSTWKSFPVSVISVFFFPLFVCQVVRCDAEVKYVLHNILYSLTHTYYKLSQNKLFTNVKRTKPFTRTKVNYPKKGELSNHFKWYLLVDNKELFL